MGTPPARAPGQYRRLTHAHAAAGVTRQGSSGPIYGTASNGPRGNGHDRRQPLRACTLRPRPRSPDTAKDPQPVTARTRPHPARDPVPMPHGRATQWLMISIRGVLTPDDPLGRRGLFRRGGCDCCCDPRSGSRDRGSSPGLTAAPAHTTRPAARRSRTSAVTGSPVRVTVSRAAEGSGSPRRETTSVTRRPTWAQARSWSSSG
jgi:hypothetical protein